MHRSSACEKRSARCRPGEQNWDPMAATKNQRPSAHHRGDREQSRRGLARSQNLRAAIELPTVGSTRSQCRLALLQEVAHLLERDWIHLEAVTHVRELPDDDAVDVGLDQLHVSLSHYRSEALFAV